MQQLTDNLDWTLQVKRELTDGNLEDFSHHFEIGRYLHVDINYSIKNYFLSFKSSMKLARAVAEKLSKLPFTEELTLVGCDSFFGNFLNEVIYQMILIRKKKDEKEICINYALLDNSNNNLSFLFRPDLKKNIIIVLPITCTFGRGFQVREFLQSYEKEENKKDLRILSPLKLNILKEFVSVFLISDKLLGLDALRRNGTELYIDLIKGDDEKYPKFIGKKKELYTSFGWDSILLNTVKFNEAAKYKEHFGSFLINLDANLSLGEYCNYCFPIHNNSDEMLRERPLLPSKDDYDTPSLIWGLPKFKNIEGKIYTHDFKRVLIRHDDPGHLFGHLKLSTNSYLHYIERDRFYENNKPDILDFFGKELKGVLQPFDVKKDRLLIISPFHQNTSTILEDLIHKEIFPKERITIKQTSPHNEFIENFLSDTNDEFLLHTYVVYFDSVISSGRTFKMISDYLKFVRNNKGFDAVLIVYDRSTVYSKKEILRNLEKAENFITYFKLNIPLMDAVNSGNPIQEINVRLKQLFEVCHLDSLKLIIKEEIERGKPLDLNTLKQKNQKYAREKRARYLLKLEISHEISNWFYDFSVNKNNAGTSKSKDFTSDNLKTLIMKVTEVVFYPNDNIGLKDSDEITEIIIKTLTQSPFKFYKDIYNAAFTFVINKLDELVLQIIREEYWVRNEDQIRTLNFYIKRSIELNSNYIVSHKFLDILKRIYENPENKSSRVKIKIFRFVYLYKQLNFKNPIRAIKMEELLNCTELLPKPISDNTLKLEDTLNNKFYQLGRLIKSDNIFLLEELKSFFLSKAFDAKNRLTGIVLNDNLKEYLRNEYFSKSANITAPELRHVRAFLKRSKHSTDNNDHKQFIIEEEICDSVEAMLRTIFLIKQKQPGIDFLKDIREILKVVCQIIGNNLDYAFCIEYTERSSGTSTEENIPKDAAPNIYTILSNSDKSNIYIHKEGLVYNMLYGLNEAYNENIQTFIAIAKGERGKIAGFQNEYYPDELDDSPLDGNKEKTVKPISIQNFSKDYKGKDTGLIDKDVKMALMFRLADISLDSSYKHKGRAVLIITSKQKANTKNFTELMNVEKVRLLLLIKEELLHYLRRQFENDAFIGLLESRKEIDFKNSMKHMLSGYFNSMDSILKSPYPLTRDDKSTLDFLQEKAHRHIKSMSTDFSKDKMFMEDPKTYTREDIKKLVKKVMKVPKFSRLDMLEGTYEWNINVKTFTCHPVVFEQIFPELLINMRRNACESLLKPKVFSITHKSDQMVFVNYFDKTMNKNPKEIKIGGGKKMCNDILSVLGITPLEQKVIDKHTFSITLNLK